jgi:hypothetical protein
VHPTSSTNDGHKNLELVALEKKALKYLTHLLPPFQKKADIFNQNPKHTEDIHKNDNIYNSW